MDSRSEKNISTSRERVEQEHKWRDMIKREIEGLLHAYATMQPLLPLLPFLVGGGGFTDGFVKIFWMEPAHNTHERLGLPHRTLFSDPFE